MKRSAKKTTPSKSKSPSKASAKYEYVELNKISVVSSDPCHFYGVIVDATFPYKKHAELFECFLKVIDPSLKPSKGKQEYATVAIYAKKFEDLPIVHRLGDIIRIHRADLELFNNGRIFKVNVCYKSSWALYSSDKLSPLGLSIGDAPYAFSGKKATQEKQDVAIQSTLKKWANQFFSQFNAVPDQRQV